MRVVILTFHRSRNYGAVMQAYALCNELNNMKVDSEIVDYKCDSIESSLKLWNSNGNPIKSVFQFIFRLRKKKAFDYFNHHYLPLSKKKDVDQNNIMDILQTYDAVIVGSDQVWNDKITGNDNVYFLKNIDCNKIAYAVSAGDSVSITQENLNAIKDFDIISVREHVLQEYLESQGVECKLCCDPTLLATKDLFSSITSPRILKKKYIFVFMIWYSDTLVNNAKRYAKENGLEVVCNKNCWRFILHCKPTDFLSWIANAEVVFTNSFHGTVFSLLFHKKFISSIVKPKDKKNVRIEELLISMGCEKNILYDESIQVTKIDIPEYKIVDKQLNKIRNEALEYVNSALSII